MAERPTIIDADGHILERQNDIRKHLPAPWNERIGGLWPGDQPWDSSLFGRLDFSRRSHLPYNRNMSAAEQVEAWHRIMDEYGFEWTMCFPTGSGATPGIRERDFQVAVARACNDHFAKDFNALSDRVKCVGVLPLRFPDAAAEELRRAVTELGIVGFELLTTGVPVALGDRCYDPLYAEAERLGAALCVHGTRHWSHEVGADTLSTFAEVHTYAFPAAMQRQFTSIVYQGVPVRYPRLKLAFLEIGVTWLPYYLDRMDEHWEKRAEVEMPVLKEKPSAVVRAAPMYFSIEAGESLLPQTVDFLGADHFVYASDIPHWDNEFPESLEHLWEHPGLSREVKEKILRDNARVLFGLPERATAVA